MKYFAYIYIYEACSICVCVCEGEKEGWEGEQGEQMREERIIDKVICLCYYGYRKFMAPVTVNILSFFFSFEILRGVHESSEAL